MSIEHSGTRKPGEPFILEPPKDGVPIPRILDTGEVILMSYTPSGRTAGDDIPVENRLSLPFPGYTNKEQTVGGHRRSQFLEPFLPETVIATIDAEAAGLAAEKLLKTGHSMVAGAGVSQEEAQFTVERVVLGDLASGWHTYKRDPITDSLTVEYNPEIKVGPLYWGRKGVLPGVGLWVPVSKS
jgi:hypothetical protein